MSCFNKRRRFEQRLRPIGTEKRKKGVNQK